MKKRPSKQEYLKQLRYFFLGPVRLSKLDSCSCSGFFCSFSYVRRTTRNRSKHKLCQRLSGISQARRSARVEQQGACPIVGGSDKFLEHEWNVTQISNGPPFSTSVPITVIGQNSVQSGVNYRSIPSTKYTANGALFSFWTVSAWTRFWYGALKHWDSYIWQMWMFSFRISIINYPTEPTIPCVYYSTEECAPNT